MTHFLEHGQEYLASSRCFEALSGSLDRIAEHYPWGSIWIGMPEEGGPWITLEDLAKSVYANRILNRILEEYEPETPERVLGNYLFRFALEVPLRLAGYLLIAERRVPMLVDNVLLRDAEWLQHGRLIEPRMFVLQGDPLAGEPGVEVISDLHALTDKLFAEIESAFTPLLVAFRARRFIALANAWGAILDTLVQGMMIAGHISLGMDEAWARWEQAIRGRSFPVRRRPLRFSLEVDGQRNEMAVRAGCCLWFITPAALRAEHGYCTSCYLTSDGKRRAIVTAQLRELASAGNQETGHGTG